MGITVRIVYPADPMGVIPGGIDTFIKGILAFSPSHINFELVGVTTDPLTRPVGQWTVFTQRNRKFRFLPITTYDNPAGRSRLPLSLRFTAATIKYRKRVLEDAAVLDFHRIEPSLVFLFSKLQKNLFIHQNMTAISGVDSDVRWKNFAWVLEFIERLQFPRFNNIWCVRRGTVDIYRNRFSTIKERIQYTPTWADNEIFHPLSPEDRQIARERYSEKYSIPMDGKWIISVGRLDKQKDPMLLLEAFKYVNRSVDSARLLFVGDGILRSSLELYVAKNSLQSKVIFCGLKNQTELANLLGASDLFALTSAYEGMPMSVLEAMSCGLPCVVTNTGEVHFIVKDKVNGLIAQTRVAADIADCLVNCLESPNTYSGAKSVEIASQYTPQSVLAPVFDAYGLP